MVSVIKNMQDPVYLDDDAPPALSSLPDQLHAVQLADSIIGTAGLQEGELRAAAVTDSSGRQEPSCVAGTSSSKPTAPTSKQALRKGFFDTKATSSSSEQGRSSSTSTSSSSKQQHIPLIKAQHPQQPGSMKPIPDFLRLPPSEQEQRLAGMKTQLLSALQPTPDTVSSVAQDSTLMAGFDDPEVMAAVAEVARDPKAFAKYANNPKVQQFYMRMGQLVGTRLEKLGGQQADAADVKAC